MKLKEGVNICGLKVEMVIAMCIIDSVYKKYNAELIITSALDGKHGNHSHHYKGLAIDARTRNVEERKHLELAGDLRTSLGDKYQVILEKDHMHIEYDPQ